MYALAEPTYAPLLEAADDALREALWEALAARSAITLRGYQIEARDAIQAEWERGRATLACLATGTGKTETFLGTLAAEQEAGRLGRALILAHRRELIYQPALRIVRGWPQLPCPGIVMAQYDMADADVIVATVQTLAAGDRLQRVLDHGPITHLVIDETHRATAPSYMRVLEELRAANPALRVLGVTATPSRTDGAGLASVFDSVAHRIGIKEAIQMGALCPFVAMGVQLPISIEGIRETRDGWDDDELGEVMSAANALELIVETWRRQAEGRPTVAFTASVAQAHRLAEAFNVAGVAAEAIDGTTPRAERWGILDRYQRGLTRVLVNCFVLVEGWDAPHTSCVINAKPTRSDLVYVQAIGRGLRTAPGKDNCLILDFHPLGGRDLVGAGDLLGEPRQQRKARKQAEESGIILDIFGIDAEGNGIDGDPDEVVLHVLDFLSSKAMRRLAWLFDGAVATVSTAKGEMLALLAPQRERVAAAEELRAQGRWQASWDVEYERISQWHLYHVRDNRHALLLASGDEETVYGRAEEWADEHAEPWAVKRKRKWRSRAPTDARRAFAQRLGVFSPEMDDGECSQAITHELALRALRRSGVIR